MTVLRSGSASDVGRVRTVNEDLALESLTLFAVADGMGGHVGGEIAARTAVDTLEAEFTRTPTAEGLVRSVGSANRAVWEASHADPGLRGMGTTLIVAALVATDDGDRLVLANVGDSRAYRLHGHDLTQLSVDHSVAEELVARGELSEAEASIHPQRHILTRALGIGPDVDVDVWQLVPKEGDRYLLCSDGLSNEVEPELIGEVLVATRDPQAAAGTLVDLANRAGGNDNITAVVLDVVVGERTEAGSDGASPAAAALPEPAPGGGGHVGDGGPVAAPEPVGVGGGSAPVGGTGAAGLGAAGPGGAGPGAAGALASTGSEASGSGAAGAAGAAGAVATVDAPAPTLPRAPAAAPHETPASAAPTPAAAPEAPPPAGPGVPAGGDGPTASNGRGTAVLGRSAAPSETGRPRHRRVTPTGERIPRRITFRVILFLLLLGGVIYGGYAAIRWYVDNSYFVGLDHGNVVIYQGRRGGFVGIEPKIVVRTNISTADVPSFDVDPLRGGVEESSLTAAKNYVNGLLQEPCILQGAPASCSTVTTTTTTTTPRRSTSTTATPAGRVAPAPGSATSGTARAA